MNDTASPQQPQQQPRKQQFVSQALPEPPLDDIKKAVEHYGELQLHIKRNTIKGTWESLPTVKIPANELATISDFIAERFGGGRFRVSARDPDNQLEEVIRPFHVETPGPRKAFEDPAVRTPGRINGIRGGGNGGMPQAFGVPSWPTYHAQREARENDVNPTDFFEMTPDAIAMENVRALREELRIDREKREKDKLDADKRIEEARREARSLENQLRQQEREHEKALAEFRLQMIEKTTLAAAQAKPPAIDWAVLFGAGVPVLVAMIEAGKSRQTALLTSQQESARMQMDLMRAFSERKETKSQLAELVPLLVGLAPVFEKFMDGRSPTAIAKLTSALADSQLETLSMAGQLMRELTPDNDNPWMNVVRSAIDGIQSVAERMAEANKQPQLGAPRVAGSLPRSQGTGSAGVQQQQQITPQSPPEEIAAMILSAPSVPREFKTSVWRQLYIGIHDVQRDPREVAAAIAKHLEALENSNTLPQLFSEVFIDNGAAPSASLQQLLMNLPVGQFHPMRVAQLLTHFDDIVGVHDGNNDADNTDQNADADDQGGAGDDDADDAQAGLGGQPLFTPAPAR